MRIRHVVVMLVSILWLGCSSKTSGPGSGTDASVDAATTDGATTTDGGQNTSDASACGDCNDHNDCTIDTCVSAQCTHTNAAAGTDCEDGDYCTVQDACDSAGACVTGVARDCDDGANCTTDSCDEAGNTCHYERALSLCTFTETDKLVAEDTTPRAGLGYAVALSSTRAAIGAPWEDVDGVEDAGAVYTFVLDFEGHWAVEARIVSDAPTREAWFGGSVDVEGDLVVVGAWRERDGSNERGTVYVYRIGELGNAALVEKISPPTDRTYGYFGHSVSISGNRFVASAPSGRSVHVYEFDGTTWPLVQSLRGETTGLDDANYGWSVSLNGDRLLVGSHGPGGSLTFAGRAFIFEREDGMFTRVATLEPEDGAGNDQYGFSVSLSGDIAAVGAYRATVAGHPQQGAVYVYERGDGSWSAKQKVVADDGSTDDWFGASVAIDGHRLLVGSFDTRARGSGYVYNFDGASTWAYDGRLTTTGSGDIDLTGWAVALHQGRALIGSYWNDVTGENSGAAFFYNLSGL